MQVDYCICEEFVGCDMVDLREKSLVYFSFEAVLQFLGLFIPLTCV